MKASSGIIILAMPLLAAILTLAVTSVASQGGPTAAGELAPFTQCGGMGGNCNDFTCIDGPFPDTTCTDGFVCCRESVWWSQCQPAGNCSYLSPPVQPSPTQEPPIVQPSPTEQPQPSPTATEQPPVVQLSPAEQPPSPTAQPGAVVAPYEQCGGLTAPDGQPSVDAPYPGVSCASGFQCCRQNQYYHQCTAIADNCVFV